MEKTEDGTVITGAAMSPQALDTLRSLDRYIILLWFVVVL